MFRKVEREAHVVIWLARNNGFDADDEAAIKATIALHQLTNDIHWDTKDIQDSMLHFYGMSSR